MLGLRKPNFKTKIIHFEISHNGESCKRGPLRFFNDHSVAKFQKNEGEPFGVFEKFSKKMRSFNSLIVPKNLKERTLWEFLKLVLLQNIKKMKGGTFGDIKNFRKKVSQSRKKGESHSAEVRTFCFGILVKKLAHTHGFEHEPFGLKSKHLTTRPRTPELCDLRAETREFVVRKKSTHTFP